MPYVTPLLLLAFAVALGLAFLRPGVWILVAVLVALLLPGRWWRWRTRRFRRGLRALERGETAAARQALEEFLAEIRRDGRFKKLQPYFNLGRRYSYEAAALSNLGIADLQEGEAGAALERFREALAHDSELAQALYGEAAALRLLGELDEAEERATRALAARPRYAAARALLGLVRLEKGEDEAAEEALAPLAEAGHDPEKLLDRLRKLWPRSG